MSSRKVTFFVGGFLVSFTLITYVTFARNYRDVNHHSMTNTSLKPPRQTKQQNPAVHLQKYANEPKTVLQWSGPNVLPKGRSIKIQFGQYECTFTSNRSVLSNSDAIIMSIGYINSADLPPLRFPWQRWIFKSPESPANHRPPRALNGKINWTLTYHRSSDIPLLFGFYRKRGSNDLGPFNVCIIDLYIFSVTDPGEAQ